MNMKLEAGLSRREMIQSLCGGIGSIGLAGLLQNLSIEGVSAAGLGRYAGPALPHEMERFCRRPARPIGPMPPKSDWIISRRDTPGPKGPGLCTIA